MNFHSGLGEGKYTGRFWNGLVLFIVVSIIVGMVIDFDLNKALDFLSDFGLWVGIVAFFLVVAWLIALIGEAMTKWWNKS